MKMARGLMLAGYMLATGFLLIAAGLYLSCETEAPEPPKAAAVPMIVVKKSRIPLSCYDPKTWVPECVR